MSVKREADNVQAFAQQRAGVCTEEGQGHRCNGVAVSCEEKRMRQRCKL